jgi:lipopolysaccharide export system protein LptC
LTIASQIGVAESRGFLSGSRPDNERAFRRALRHSRFVRFTRVAIPVLIILGAAGAFAAYRWFDPLRAFAKLPISVDGVVLSGTKIMMQKPMVHGFTQDKQPYTVTARTAAQDATNPDIIELQYIQASVALADQGKVHLTANEGVYDGRAERLRLQNEVVVRSSEFEALLSEAVVNVRSGDVVSERPVEVRMLQGTINSNRLEIRGSGEVVRFDGGVTLLIEAHALQRDVTGTAR